MTADEERSRPQARTNGRAGATRRAVLAGGVASGVAIAAGSARAQALLGAGDTMPPAPQDGTTDIFHGAHAYKFVATLGGQSPTSEVRLKVETRAGHGFGNALNKTLDRATDTLAFLWQKLGGPVLELPKISS